MEARAAVAWETRKPSAMEGKIGIDDLITHTMPLEGINDAFDPMHWGEAIRSVVLF